jgi:UDP-glucose-4-epimerase GalE
MTIDLRAVLVTGGAGYIGAHNCKSLSEAGYLPVTLDNFATGHRKFVQWGPLIEADISNTAAVISAIRDFKISAVMHFAAFSQVGESVADPHKYYLNNVGGTLSLLQAMRTTGCDTMIFSSTGAVYGNAGHKPISEAAAGCTVNPYGASKWMVEQIIEDHRRAYDLRAVSLRYFNASGADASKLIGELRDPETHLIPRAMLALQGHVRDFAVFGKDYETPDGTAIRDYIHVADLAAAHLHALVALREGFEGGSFNLGTGAGFSVLEVLSAIAKEAGREVPTVLKERRPGDPPILVADASAAQELLGWTPKCSDLPTIVKSAWNWHQVAHPPRC